MQPLLSTATANQAANFSPSMMFHKALADWARPMVSRQGYGNGQPPMECLIDRLTHPESRRPASARRPTLVDTVVDGARMGCFFIGLPIYAVTKPAAFVASAGLSATHGALIQFTKNHSERGSGVGQLVGLAAIGALMVFSESVRWHYNVSLLGCLAVCGAAGALCGAMLWAMDRNRGGDGPLQKQELGFSWPGLKFAYLKNSGKIPYPPCASTWNFAR